MGTKAASIVVEFTADTIKLVQGTTNATIHVDRQTRQMERFGRTASAVVTAGLMAAAAGWMRHVASMDTEQRKLKEGWAGNERSLRSFITRLEDVGQTGPVSAKQLVGIAASVAKAFGDDEKAIRDVTEAVRLFQVATGETALEEPVIHLGQALAATAKEYPLLMGAATALSDKSQSSAKAIIENSQSLAGLRATAKASIGDVLGLATALAELGIEGGAGAGIMKLGTATAKAVDQGGEKLRQFAQLTNMTTDDFSKAWAADPMDVLLKIIAALGSGGDAAGSMLDEMVDLGLGAGRSGNALGIMAINIAKIREKQADANALMGDGNRLQKEAAERSGSWSNKMKILWNNVEGFGTAMGTILKPTLGTIIELGTVGLKLITDVVQWVARADDGVKVFVGSLLLLAGLVGPVTQLIVQLKTLMALLAVAKVPAWATALLGVGRFAAAGAMGAVAGAAFVGYSAVRGDQRGDIDRQRTADSVNQLAVERSGVGGIKGISAGIQARMGRDLSGGGLLLGPGKDIIGVNAQLGALKAQFDALEKNYKGVWSTLFPVDEMANAAKALEPMVAQFTALGDLDMARKVAGAMDLFREQQATKERQAQEQLASSIDADVRRHAELRAEAVSRALQNAARRNQSDKALKTLSESMGADLAGEGFVPEVKLRYTITAADKIGGKFSEIRLKISEEMDGLASRMADAIARFAREGSSAFDGFASSVIEDLIRISAQAVITQPFADWMKGILTGGGDGTSGGNAAPPMPTPQLPHSVPTSMGSSGLSSKSTVHIHNYAGAAVSAETSVDAQGGETVSVFIDNSVDRSFARGRFNKRMARYGLVPVGIPR